MALLPLQMQQVENKMKQYRVVRRVQSPSSGWIKAIRQALGMSAEQLGRKLGITRQAVMDLEKREKDDAITLRALRAAATAMDMELVYGFIPKDGSLEELIDRKARELAREIVTRTSNNMRLEGQENSKERISRAIEERADSIKREMPKALWD